MHYEVIKRSQLLGTKHSLNKFYNTIRKKKKKDHIKNPLLYCASKSIIEYIHLRFDSMNHIEFQKMRFILARRYG